MNVVYQMKYEMIRDRHFFCLVISSLFVTYLYLPILQTSRLEL